MRLFWQSKELIRTQNILTERQADRIGRRFKEEALKSIIYLMPTKENNRAGAGNGMKDATFAYRDTPKSYEKLNQKID